MQKKEGKQDNKSKEEVVVPLKKKMKGAIPPLPVTPPFSPPAPTTTTTPMIATPMKPTTSPSQGTHSLALSVDDFLDLDMLNKIMEEDNQRASKARREEEGREAKEGNHG